MKNGQTKVIDRGAGRILGDLKDLKNANVTIGVHSNAAPYPDGTPVQFVATENEFGNSRVPERSFLRSTFDEHREDWREKQRGLLKGVIEGKSSANKVLRIMGFQIAAEVQNKIITLRTPPNAPSTVAKKPNIGNNPLIDSRHLLGSIGFQVNVNGNSDPVIGGPNK